MGKRHISEWCQVGSCAEQSLLSVEQVGSRSTAHVARSSPGGGFFSSPVPACPASGTRSSWAVGCAPPGAVAFSEPPALGTVLPESSDGCSGGSVFPAGSLAARSPPPPLRPFSGLPSWPSVPCSVGLGERGEGRLPPLSEYTNFSFNVI